MMLLLLLLLELKSNLLLLLLDGCLEGSSRGGLGKVGVDVLPVLKGV
jgi:hypothetical protein